jgi:hypothetical protein
MKYKQTILVTALLLFVFLPGNIWGQEEKEEPEGKSDISLFLGGSSNFDETAFTIGVDYQYRISRVFGVGAILDHAAGDIKSTLVAPALFLHVKKLSFTVAPGAEFSDDDTAMVLRVGAQYHFELSRFSIIPAIFYDTERNGDPTWVYGLGFSMEI